MEKKCNFLWISVLVFLYAILQLSAEDRLALSARKKVRKFHPKKQYLRLKVSVKSHVILLKFETSLTRNTDFNQKNSF